MPMYRSRTDSSSWLLLVCGRCSLIALFAHVFKHKLWLVGSSSIALSSSQCSRIPGTEIDSFLHTHTHMRGISVELLLSHDPGISHSLLLYMYCTYYETRQFSLYSHPRHEYRHEKCFSRAIRGRKMSIAFREGIDSYPSQSAHCNKMLMSIQFKASNHQNIESASRVTTHYSSLCYPVSWLSVLEMWQNLFWQIPTRIYAIKLE